jgi:catechol 2,3-dioxygenase-like lactoylglutathione lyase family enzyme
MMTMIERLSSIEMICGDPNALAAFYQTAFGFLGSHRAGGPARGINQCVRLRLENQEIALVGVEPQGRPYPANVAGWSPLFQHVAIVVSDMAIAYARLSAITGWTPISTSGPQLLPAASGGVIAFKFRDPEGHPLELIAFPANAIPSQWQMNLNSDCLGIDHSAVSVANTAKSIDFYQSLGLSRGGGSLNIGTEQARLDDIAKAVVEVTALMPTQSTPHLELLCYRGDFDRHVQQHTNDISATRLVFSVESRVALESLVGRHPDNLVTDSTEGKANAGRVLLRDPDGHLICLETAA